MLLNCPLPCCPLAPAMPCLPTQVPQPSHCVAAVLRIDSSVYALTACSTTPHQFASLSGSGRALSAVQGVLHLLTVMQQTVHPCCFARLICISRLPGLLPICPLPKSWLPMSACSICKAYIIRNSQQVCKLTHAVSYPDCHKRWLTLWLHHGCNKDRLQASTG